MLFSQKVAVIEHKMRTGKYDQPKTKKIANVTPEGGNQTLTCGSYSISAAARHMISQAQATKIGRSEIALIHLS